MQENLKLVITECRDGMNVAASFQIHDDDGTLLNEFCKFVGIHAEDFGGWVVSKSKKELELLLVGFSKIME